MIIETLQQLGLSPNESKIYEALLELKEAGAGEISSKRQELVRYPQKQKYTEEMCMTQYIALLIKG